MIKKYFLYTFLLLIFFVTDNFLVANDTHKFVVHTDDSVNQEHWLNVFIHGAYRPTIGLLSMLNVIRGNTDYTLYKTIQKQFRNCSFDHQTRLMSAQGLEWVDLEKTYHCHTSIVQPVLKVYNLLASKLSYKNDHRDKKIHIHNEYYTFGWDGILSHKARQCAASKLFEALKKEYSDYVKRTGFIPKIRLICHSHGGNVALNMGALSDFHDAYSQGFCVDELIMYGTPIQAETEALCFLPMFKKVFNMYSDNDRIQGFDWMSTKTRKSSQRIHLSDDYLKNPLNRVIQVKIMVQRIIPAKSDSGKKSIKESFSKLIPGGKSFFQQRYDPTHGDFWKLGDWKRNRVPFDPLPMVAYTPLLLGVIDQSSCDDVDINLFADNAQKAVMFNVYEHDKHQANHLHAYRFPLDAIEKLKQEIFMLKPKQWAYSFKLSLNDD